MGYKFLRLVQEQLVFLLYVLGGKRLTQSVLHNEFQASQRCLDSSSRRSRTGPHSSDPPADRDPYYHCGHVLNCLAGLLNM